VRRRVEITFSSERPLRCKWRGERAGAAVRLGSHSNHSLWRSQRLLCTARGAGSAWVCRMRGRRKGNGKGWPQRQHGPETAISPTAASLPLRRGTGQRLPGTILETGLVGRWGRMKCPNNEWWPAVLVCWAAGHHPSDGVFGRVARKEVA